MWPVWLADVFRLLRNDFVADILFPNGRYFVAGQNNMSWRMEKNMKNSNLLLRKIPINPDPDFQYWAVLVFFCWILPVINLSPPWIDFIAELAWIRWYRSADMYLNFHLGIQVSLNIYWIFTERLFDCGSWICLGTRPSYRWKWPPRCRKIMWAKGAVVYIQLALQGIDSGEDNCMPSGCFMCIILAFCADWLHISPVCCIKMERPFTWLVFINGNQLATSLVLVCDPITTRMKCLQVANKTLPSCPCFAASGSIVS